MFIPHDLNERMKPADWLTAKTKSIMIELHDYAFFHSPSNLGQSDRRFIGRKRIKERLKSLLLDNETESGSYLITGYRGAGKTSLVAETLADLTSGKQKPVRSPHYWGIILFLMPLFLLEIGVIRDQETGLRVIVSLIGMLVLGLSWMVLRRLDPSRHNLLTRRPFQKSESPSVGTWSGIWGGICEWVRTPGVPWWKPFVVSPGLCAQRRTLLLFKDLYLAFLIDWLVTTVYLFSQIAVDGQAVLRIRRLLPFYFIAIVILIAASELTAVGLSKRRALSVKDFFRRLRQGSKAFISFSHKVCIRINLGKERLSEAEILRMMANRMLIEYRNIRRPRFRDLPWRVVKPVFIWFFVGLVYYNPAIFKLNQNLKADSRLVFYTPSQAIFLLDKERPAFSILTDNALGLTADKVHTKIESLSSIDQPCKRNLQLALTKGAQNQPTDSNCAPLSFVTAIHIEMLEHFGSSQDKDVAFGDARRNLASLVAEEIENPPRLATRLVVHTDVFVKLTYRKVFDTFPSIVRRLANQKINRYWLRSKKRDIPGNPGGSESIVVDEFQLIPANIDYLFFLYFFFVWQLVNVTSRTRIFGFSTHGRVLRRLIRLNDAIDAQVTRENTGEFSGNKAMPLKFLRRTTRSYQLATDREVETELMSILDETETIPRVTGRPAFVFVFDELDKIEPHKNISLREEEEEVADSGRDAQRFSSFEAARERQHRILYLLANLKHFFSTAHAKFLFVAGREMFDASLADVSDRHYFMGSIFNHVLYVPSFLSDPTDGRLSDVTSMTEKYLCQFLVPRCYSSESPSLATFHQYLQTDMFHRDVDSFDDWMNDVITQVRQKIMFDLHNFVVYLTYRSHGSPKKITSLLEAHITPFSESWIVDDEAIIIGKSSNSLYLRLSFYDQYTCGLITYLANPLFLSINRSIKDFGDKLLVSISFLLDHLYKFHGAGFTPRSLELIPEIVDINRAPELRGLITTIMRFLGRTHIDEIASGLYQYKFRRRINEEVSFLSKVSEREAAAFNFTLDESLSMKRHYYQRLRHFLSTYRPYGRMVETDNYVHSVGFIRMILGDLHFYDEEYDQAILEYMEATQWVQGAKPEKLGLHRLVLAIRNLMKLGLTFEKKKTYDSAFVTYGRLRRIVGLVASHAAAMASGEASRNTNENHTIPKSQPESDESSPSIDEAVQAASIHLNELVSTFEALRLQYQPILAQLHVREKSSLNGIPLSVVIRAEKQFNEITSVVAKEERAFIESEFFNKLGNLLFFKNGPVHPRFEKKPASKEWSQLPCNHRKGKLRWCQNCNAEKSMKDGALSLPCTACHFYTRSLETQCRGFELIDLKNDHRQTNDLTNLLQSLAKSRNRTRPLNELREVANNLSDLGDTFLSCAFSENDKISLEFLKPLLLVLDEERLASQTMEPKLLPNNKTEETVFCFVLSALFSRGADAHKAYAFQLTKILWVLREIISIGDSEELGKWTPNDIEFLEKHLVRRAIQGVYRTYESTHRLEIERMKEIFEEELELQENAADTDAKGREIAPLVPLNGLSVTYELREIVLIFNEIRLMTGEKEWRPSWRWLSTLNPVNSMYNRIHELRFRASVNWRILRSSKLSDKLTTLHSKLKPETRKVEPFWKTTADVKSCRNIFGVKESSSIKQGYLVEFLITDSIFCLHEIIDALRVYGISYMAHHTMRASAHDRLVEWCEHYFTYIRTIDLVERNRVEESLGKLIGKSNLIDITPQYHRERALVHYENALEAHNQGRAYKEIVHQMYYLNDDYNDKLTHFCAALERFRINSGTIENRMKDLKADVAETVFEERNYRWFPGCSVARDRV